MISHSLNKLMFAEYKILHFEIENYPKKYEANISPYAVFSLEFTIQ